jgi:uncharacterized Fe-S cluster-containing radical SAM superfamily protein
MRRIARFEIDAVKSCNLSCAGCNHLSPAFVKGHVDPAALEVDLRVVARHIHAANVRILGGEPLLHPDILGVIDAARRSGLGETLSVVTNGVLLARMPAAFWEKVDLVDVSIYPGVAVDEGVLRAHAGKVIVRRPDTFYETFSTLRNEDEAQTRRIFETCTLLDFCIGLCDRRVYRCMRSAFIPAKVAHASLHDGIDGLPVEDDAGFEPRLARYLDGKDPLASCSFCTGTSGAAFPHVQVRRADWMARQARPLQEMLDPTRV